MNRIAEDVRRATDWFMGLSDTDKRVAVKALFHHAFESDYISIFEPAEADELAKDSRKPIEYWLAPYFTGNGEPIHIPF